MRKIMFWVNALLTLPVGLGILFFPVYVLGFLGSSIPESVQFVGRLCGLTMISYGFVFFLFRNSKDTETIRSIFITAGIFNIMMALIMGIAGKDGLISSIAWGLVIAHTFVAVLCMYSYLSE